MSPPLDPPAAVDPDLDRARALLDGTDAHPVQRARRIAGLFAALYVEEPLLHQWCGLACFVARHIHDAMTTPEPLYFQFMAEGNRRIYEAMMPAFLRFRDRRPDPGPMATAFQTLRSADQAALANLRLGEELALTGMRQLAEHEQGVVIQPAYDRLPGLPAHILAPLMRFNLGWDSAAPEIGFDGDDPREAAQRIAWATTEVLPAWQAERAAHGPRLRQHADRVRRWAGVRMEELPRAAGDLVG